MHAVQYTDAADILSVHGFAANQIGHAGNTVLNYGGTNTGADIPDNNGGTYVCVCAYLPPPSPPQPPLMPGCSNAPVVRQAVNMETTGEGDECYFQVPDEPECQSYADASTGRTYMGAQSFSASHGAGPGCFSIETAPDTYEIRYNTDMHPQLAILRPNVANARMVCFRGRTCLQYSSGGCQISVYRPSDGAIHHVSSDNYFSEHDNTVDGHVPQPSFQMGCITNDCFVTDPVTGDRIPDSTNENSLHNKMFGPLNHLEWHEANGDVKTNGRIAWEDLYVDQIGRAHV